MLDFEWIIIYLSSLWDLQQDSGEILAARIFASRRESWQDSRQEVGKEATNICLCCNWKISLFPYKLKCWVSRISWLGTLKFLVIFLTSQHDFRTHARKLINPLTPGPFCKRCIFWTFWWFLGWISANLPLIRSKMRLQHNSLPFLPPASRFSALWLGHAQKSKFWEKVTYVFRLFDFWNFLFALTFSPFLLFLLQWLTFYWACLQLKNFWESVIETGKF